jgi:hypothetical protein
MLFYGNTGASEYIRRRCLTKKEILDNTNQQGFVKNSDGSVSVYKYNDSFELYPVALTLECCKALDPTYYFDINTQTCRWAQPHDTCGFSEPINLIVNPKGDDGTLFFVDDFEKETCDLKISFDYLLKIKCEDLLNIVNPTITTNIQSQETIKQTVSLQMEIESVNTEIETITNEVVLLNEEYLTSLYSIECKQFPIITPPGPCVRPSNLPVVGFWNKINIDNTGIKNFESTNTTACNAALYNKNTNAKFNGQDNNVTKFAVGGTVYSNITTNCNLFSDGHFITNLDTREVTHVLNGVIQSISICPDPTAAPAVKQNLYITPFDNTAFVSPTESRIDYMTKYGIKPLFQYYNPNFITITDFESFATLDNSIDYTTRYGGIKPIYQTYNPNFIRPTEFDTYISWDPTDSYTSVNYCLTDLGLQTWETILKSSGGDYQLFLQGDSANPGYTCADVITLSNQPNAGDLFYDCTIPFGTKSSIKLKINQHMTELSLLSETLTNLQDELIKLQNTFIETTDSNKGCDTMIDALESFDIEMHLDIVNADNTITSVFSAATFPAINSTTNLYDYLIKNPNSGFYICGDPSNNNVGFSACTSLSLDNDVTPNVDSCDSIIDDLIDGLNKVPGSDITKISNSAFSSEWLSYTKVISDSKIIDLIKNKKIKISFKVKFSCVDFCLLLDNIVLDKSCKNVDRNDIIISQNPGFDLKRVIDNKKSWIDTTVPTNREFFVSKSNGTNPIRQTDYNVNDERLVINSKEIDLDISVASAIETDVWCFISDNPTLLDCNCDSITKEFSINNDIDFNEILTLEVPAKFLVESAYTTTAYWGIEVAGSCGDLYNNNNFFVGTNPTLAPNSTQFKTELDIIALNLGYSIEHNGNVSTLTKIYDCGDYNFNDTPSIKTNLNIYTCYIDTPSDCGELNSFCDDRTLIKQFIYTGIDFLDDINFYPTCEELGGIFCSAGDSTFPQNKDANLKAQNELNLWVNMGGYDYEFPDYSVANDFSWATGQTGYYKGVLKKVNMKWWRATDEYSEWYENIPCVGTSLSTIFLGITGFTYLHPVTNIGLAPTGVSGNKIRTTGGTQDDYYWSPINNDWALMDDCIGSKLADLDSRMRARRDATLKAKNEFILSQRPYLMSAFYLPNFQVKKYLL